jgi:hypothetical protein
MRIDLAEVTVGSSGASKETSGASSAGAGEQGFRWPPEAPKRSYRSLVVVATVVGVVALLAFLFLWPLPHSQAGQVSTSSSLVTVNLPGGTNVTFQWNVVSGGPVHFIVAYFHPACCSPPIQSGNGSTFAFITPGSGMYRVAITGEGAGATTVNFSVSYDMPVL